MKSLEQILKDRKNTIGMLAPNNNENHLRDASLDNYEDNPAYRKVTHYRKQMRHGKEEGIHFIVKQRNYGEREIFFIPNIGHDFRVGDYIKDKIGDIWLIFSNDTYPLYKGYLALCNSMLKWKDESGDVYTLPVVLTDKTSVYSDGLSKTEKMMLRNDQILLVVPDTPEVRAIPYNKRIIFNNDKNEIYQVVRKDTVHLNGTMHIRMRHDEYKPELDNLELGLADYHITNGKDEEISSESDNERIKTIKIEGYDNLPFNEEEDFKAQVYVAGAKVPDIVSWEIEEGSHLATITNIEENIITLKGNCEREYGKVVLVAKLVDNDTIVAKHTIELSRW